MNERCEELSSNLQSAVIYLREAVELTGNAVAAQYEPRMNRATMPTQLPFRAVCEALQCVIDGAPEYEADHLRSIREVHGCLHTLSDCLEAGNSFGIGSLELFMLFIERVIEPDLVEYLELIEAEALAEVA